VQFVAKVDIIRHELHEFARIICENLCNSWQRWTLFATNYTNLHELFVKICAIRGKGGHSGCILHSFFSFIPNSNDIFTGAISRSFENSDGFALFIACYDVVNACFIAEMHLFCLYRQRFTYFCCPRKRDGNI
jgi:hypothetical protein